MTTYLDLNVPLPAIPRADLAQRTGCEFVVPWHAFRVWDAVATNLPAAAANDDLGLVGGTWATDSVVIEAGDLKAAGATTRYAWFSWAIDEKYDSGQALTLRIRCKVETTVADTSCTVDVECYKADHEGGIGSDLVSTSATSFNSTTVSNKDFVISPTGLEAGDILNVRLAVACNDAATGTAVTPQIGKVSWIATVKG